MIEQLPSAISLMRQGCMPMSFASLYWPIPFGFSNSSRPRQAEPVRSFSTNRNLERLPKGLKLGQFLTGELGANLLKKADRLL